VELDNQSVEGEWALRKTREIKQTVCTKCREKLDVVILMKSVSLTWEKQLLTGGVETKLGGEANLAVAGIKKRSGFVRGQGLCEMGKLT